MPKIGNLDLTLACEFSRFELFEPFPSRLTSFSAAQTLRPLQQRRRRLTTATTYITMALRTCVVICATSFLLGESRSDKQEHDLTNFRFDAQAFFFRIGLRTRSLCG